MIIKYCLKYFLVAMGLFFFNISTANAMPVSYKISAFFYEPNTGNGPLTVPVHTMADGTFVASPFEMRGYTKFDGSFSWDSATNTISGLQGTQNESMYTPAEFPDISLTHQLAQSVVGDIVTATVFKENTTDVFSNGGYAKGAGLYYGFSDGNVRNHNAYFTLVFDKTTMQANVVDMVYGDCTPGGMMGPFCMTGHSNIGTMSAYPIYANISAVPLPATVWLFSTALAGLLGVGRKRALFS